MAMFDDDDDDLDPDDYDVDDYDSGPYCRHWDDPSDCEKVCARCGHGCLRHGIEDKSCMDGIGTFENACSCQEWSEPSE